MQSHFCKILAVDFWPIEAQRRADWTFTLLLYFIRSYKEDFYSHYKFFILTGKSGLGSLDWAGNSGQAAVLH